MAMITRNTAAWLCIAAGLAFAVSALAGCAILTTGLRDCRAACRGSVSLYSTNADGESCKCGAPE
jgi:hypothetical protein